MQRKIFSLLSVGVLGGLVGPLGCSGEVASNEDEPARKVVVRETTFVIENTDDVIVEADRLSFPADTHQDVASRKADQVLVGDRAKKLGTKNPDGFLRRVKSVRRSGDLIVVDTTQASMTDAVSDGLVQAEVRLIKKPGPSISGFSPGLRIQGNEVIEGPELSLPELDEKVDFVKIEDKAISVKLGGKTVPLSFTAKASGGFKGSLKFSPKLDIGIDIQDGSLKELHTIFRGTAEASMKYYLTGETYIKEGSKKLDILVPEKSAFYSLIETASKEELNGYMEMLKGASQGSVLSWTPYNQSFILGTLFIGPVPVPISLSVTLGASCSPKVFASASVESGVTGTFELGVGARYTNYKGEDAWKPVFDHSGNIAASGLKLEGKVGAAIECSIKPTLGLIFYGLAGPTVWVAGGYKAEGGVSVACDGGTASASAYLNGNFFVQGGVGAKLGIFLPGYSLTLKETELTLATWNVENFGKLALSKSLGSIPAPICASCAASTCQVGQFAANSCVNESSIKVCSVDAKGCGSFEARDCAAGSGACFADPRACACGAECPGEGAVGSCTGSAGVLVCQKDDDGCLHWQQQPCKGSDICFADPKKCAQGDGGQGGNGQGGSGQGGNGGSGNAGGSGQGGSGAPLCGVGLACTGSSIPGSSACLQKSGDASPIYCCPDGEVIENGACKAPAGWPVCGSGLSCAADSTSGATACVQKSGDSSPIYCCPSGKVIENGACKAPPSWPVCGSGLSCAADSTSGATACVQQQGDSSPIYCCPSGKVASGGACITPWPVCGSGLSCAADSTSGATACVQKSGDSSPIYCCPSGKVASGGACITPWPVCGSGLSCAASSATGATACVQKSGDASPIYCCPSGKVLSGGACITPWPVCGSGLSCAGSAVTGSSACVQKSGDASPIYCCPSGKAIVNGACK